MHVRTLEYILADCQNATEKEIEVTLSTHREKPTKRFLYLPCNSSKLEKDKLVLTEEKHNLRQNCNSLWTLNIELLLRVTAFTQSIRQLPGEMLGRLFNPDRRL